MLGTDPTHSSDSLDPRRRVRHARLGAPGTATAMRFEGLLIGLRTLFASAIAHLERR